MAKENLVRGIWNRLLQLLARNAPGARTLRVRLNRWRGVNIADNVWIGYDAVIETSHPEYVTLKAGSSVGIRATIIAHMREQRGVVIEEDAIIGPGAMVLPGVTVGRGSIVTAGSVVTSSIPPMTLAQGNPARPIARIGIPLKVNVTMREFVKRLRPLPRPADPR